MSAGPRLDPLRARARVVLLASFGLGLVVGRSRRLSDALVRSSLVLPVLAALAILRVRRAGAAGSRARAASDPPVRVLVVIPARDEAAVLPDLLRDIAVQDIWAADEAAARIIVVDDGSSDGTAEVAAAAIAEIGLRGRASVVHRPPPASTKAAALAAAGPGTKPPADLVVVLDADARIEPGFVRRAAAVVGRGQPATARRRVLAVPSDAGRPRLVRSLGARLARLQDDELSLDLVVQRARWLSGGGSELRGNGMLVSEHELAAVGGWPTQAICEDLELSTALFLDHALAIRPVADLEVWEQPVTSLGALVRQRIRWSEGAIRRDLRLVLPRLADRSVPIRGRVDVAAYAAQTLVGVVLGGLALGRRSVSVSARLLASYGGAALVLALAGLPGLPPHRRVGRAAAVVAFLALWPIVTAVAWLRVALGRGAGDFRPTRKHSGFSAPWDPVATS